MNNKFYLSENGKQVGPFTLDEIKNKEIQPDTLVWTEGFTDWTLAKHVPLLKDYIKSSPPPLSSQKQFVPPPTPTASNASDPSNQAAASLPLAGIGERMGAYFVNVLVILIPLFLFTGESPTSDGDDLIGVTIVFSIFFAITGAVSYRLWGGNIGHRVLGLQVISAETGKLQNNIKMGILREFLKSMLGLFVIPTVWLLFDSKRQNTYDKIMKTIVVKKIE